MSQGTIGASQSLRRIRKELEDIMKDPPINCSAGPCEDNLREWDAFLVGPEDTPYAGGYFALGVSFPEDYPIKPPQVSFKTKIYHCNVYPSGEICLDILKSKWTPALTIGKVLISISSLLEDPNPDSPANVDAAKLYRRNQSDHDKIAAEWTARHAT